MQLGDEAVLLGGLEQLGATSLGHCVGEVLVHRVPL
jgi:hypothetical protein